MKLALFLVSIYLTGLSSSEPLFRQKSTGLTPLIVGGRAATQGQFPYQLSLKLNRKFHCGASLVEVNGLQVGLTSAQCVTGSIIQYSLVAGELDLEDNSENKKTQDVMRIVSHPSYTNTPSYHNDIAVLFIREPYQLNENVQTVKLPEVGRTTEGNLTVSGWGRLWDNGPYPNLLHYVNIPVVNNTACSAAWNGYGNEIIDGQLCAGEFTGSVSPCNGDTGGPAISENGYLAGIVSWGWGCGHPEYPGVFTKVSQYVEWIGMVVQLHKQMNSTY